MDFWMNKFEDMLTESLSTKVMTDYGSLSFHMSRLNLNNNKTKIFDALTELHYCDCCEKHQIDKPCIPVKWVDNKTPTPSVISCLCDCRHTARMICRMCEE